MPSHLLSGPELEAAWDRLHITKESMLSSTKWPFLDVNCATLLAVYYQFVTIIPFENLDFHRNKPFVMHFPALYNKMIVRCEGGICYELHGMLAILLESLGFRVRVVPVFVNRNRDVDTVARAFTPDSTHVNTFVSLIDEKGATRGFACEMGVGTVSGPLNRELDTEQFSSDGGKYRFRQDDEHWVFLELWQAKTERWVTRYRVSLLDFDVDNAGGFQHRFPEAFFPGLIGCSQPGTPHQSSIMVYKLRSRDPHWKALFPSPSTVTCSLMDGLYAETCRTLGEATTRTERRIETAQEYADVLWTEFGLKAENPQWPLNFPVILEKDKSLKPSPRFPVLNSDGVDKAHTAFCAGVVLVESKTESASTATEGCESDPRSLKSGESTETPRGDGKRQKLEPENGFVCS